MRQRAQPDREENTAPPRTQWGNADLILCLFFHPPRFPPVSGSLAVSGDGSQGRHLFMASACLPRQPALASQREEPFRVRGGFQVAPGGGGAFRSSLSQGSSSPSSWCLLRGAPSAQDARAQHRGNWSFDHVLLFLQGSLSPRERPG